MGSHQVVNYAVYELSLVHADMIPWFYSPFTTIFEVPLVVMMVHYLANGETQITNDASTNVNDVSNGLKINNSLKPEKYYK